MQIECTCLNNPKIIPVIVIMLLFAEPLINPRRGSATGSYGLPVPPEWLRSQAEGRRGSRPAAATPGRDSPTGPWPPQRPGVSDKVSPRVHGKKSSIPTDRIICPVVNGGSTERRQKVSTLKSLGRWMGGEGVLGASKSTLLFFLVAYFLRKNWGTVLKKKFSN